MYSLYTDVITGDALNPGGRQTGYVQNNKGFYEITVLLYSAATMWKHRGNHLALISAPNIPQQEDIDIQLLELVKFK